MQGLIDSFRLIFAKYKIEIFLIISAFVIAIISLSIFVINQTAIDTEIPILSQTASANQQSGKIFVDLAGAVEKAQVYEVSSGARLKDVLILAGGLSQDADRVFFARNFNLARLMQDQEKIYIPTFTEIQTNAFATIEQAPINTDSGVLGLSDKINLNTASMDQLDTLPGVGKITAQKIIQNRPYQSLEDMLNKKIVGKSVFEKIKDLITIN